MKGLYETLDEGPTPSREQICEKFLGESKEMPLEEARLFYALMRRAVEYHGWDIGISNYKRDGWEVARHEKSYMVTLRGDQPLDAMVAAIESYYEETER